jgi:GT2 family glycosyltransferase
MNAKKATVVIPVYADWPSLKSCIESLKKYLAQGHKVLLVNDIGPDAEELEKNIKQAIKGQKAFSYFRNPHNLGFVGTCNRAVQELDKSDNDILLLNSDTEVTAGFLEEMIGVMYSKDRIAAVSPRTNNATIATVPLSAISQKGIDPEKSYKKFTELSKRLPRYIEVPTAHGFCMLIRRSVIKEHGFFDPVFGKGYGEEVDFCQRVKKRGFLSVLSNRAYVFHLEARSFTLKKKAELIEQNNHIIRSRYPNYQQSVRDYIEAALFEEEGIKPPSAIKLSKTKLKKHIKNLIGKR